MMSDLHNAVKKGDIAAVRELLEDDVEVDEWDELEGTTPLYAACEAGRRDIAELLIKHGANTNGYLIDTGRGKSPLYAAAKEGHTDLVAFLLQNGARANLSGEEHLEPLYYAENGAIVRLLLDAGGRWYLEDSTDCYWEAHHQAAMDGRVEALKELIKHPEIDLDAEARCSGTPLNVAAYHGHIECIEALLEAGAWPLCEDDYGKNAIELCQASNPVYGRIVLMIGEAGDWEFYDVPGMEAALPEVWEKKPESLSKFFACLTPTARAKIQAALCVLTRGKITEEGIRQKIMAEAFKEK